MSFFDTFNSGVIEPAEVSYTSIALSTNITLSWPSLDATGNFTANIIEVTPSAGSLSITMPNATQRGVGQQVLFRNMTGTAFTVKDNAGGTIASIPANTAIFIYLVLNTTAAGSWSLVTFGAGTSTADAASLAGAGLKAIGITLNQKHDVVETSSNITIDSTYRAKTVVWTSGSLTCTLPSSSTIGSDFFFIAKNAGAGSTTFTPNGADTIDGAGSLVLAPNEAAMLFSSGSTHWYTVGVGRTVVFAFTQLVKNVAGAVDITLTSAECSNKVMTFTGLLTGNINVIVTNTVSVYYLFNNTSGAFTLTVKTAAGSGIAVVQGTHDIAVCDATNVARAVTNTAATTAFSAGSVSAPGVTFIGDTDTGLYEPAANQVGVATGGAAGAIFTSTGATIPSVITSLIGTDAASVFQLKTGGTVRWNIETTGTLDPNVTNSVDLGATTNTVRAGYFGTSVVTPLVDAAVNGVLLLKTGGGSDLNFDTGTGAVKSVSDNVVSFGKATNRWLALFTSTVDSGVAGSLSLKTNNGTTGFVVNHVASAVNVVAALGGATLSDPGFLASGSDTNVGIRFFTQGTGVYTFNTTGSGTNTQFQVLHTASSTSNATITGAAAAGTVGATMGVTDGRNLAITPTLVLGKAQVGGAAFFINQNYATF